MLGHRQEEEVRALTSPGTHARAHVWEQEVEKAKELLKKKDKKSALTCMKRKVCAYTCG